MPGDVVALTGPPGAGKTTTAVALAAQFGKGVHLRTDDFWQYIVAGAIPPWMPESDQQNQTVMRVIIEAAFTYAEGGYMVVVDGIVGPWMLHHVDRGLREHRGVPVHYMVLRPDRQATLTRAQGRTSPDALVDEFPVLTMWDQFADLNSLESHVIDSSHQSSAETLHAVTTAIASGAFRLPSDQYSNTP